MDPPPYEADALLAWVRAADRWLIGLDYDGTLAEIADRPASAVLPDERRALVVSISRIPGVRLVVVTGRAVASLDSVMNAAALERVGLHGFEHAAPGQVAQLVRPEDGVVAEQLGRVHAALEARLRAAPGSWTEHKGVALALHTRECTPADERAAQDIFREALVDIDDLEYIAGKRILEARPPGINKGTTLQKLSREDGGRPVFYAGDDTTDEDAFSVLDGTDAFTLKVGSGPSAARYSVSDPERLRAVLEDLQRALREKTGRA